MDAGTIADPGSLPLTSPDECVEDRVAPGLFGHDPFPSPKPEASLAHFRLCWAGRPGFMGKRAGLTCMGWNSAPTTLFLGRMC